MEAVTKDETRFSKQYFRMIMDFVRKRMRYNIL